MKWFTMLTLLLLSAVGEGETVYYVATKGNDEWSGKLAAPNRKKTNGPFATLARARDAARKVPKPATIFLRGGIYFLSEPLTLNEKDSGLTIAAYKGETPILSGGRRIGGWHEGRIGGLKDAFLFWTTEIPEAREGKWIFRELWFNGDRATRARHPNHGYLALEAGIDEKEKSEWTDGQRKLRFKAGDLKAWPSVSDAEVVTMTRWVESRLPVSSVDEKERIVTFGKRTVFHLDPGDLYYIENVLEALDERGEWFLDSKSGKLYLWPFTDLLGHEVDMTRAEVIAPRLPQILIAKNISGVTLRGLTFSHSEWYFPKDSKESGFSQAAIGVPAAVSFEGARDCLIENCALTHMGTYGLELGRGCQHNKISRCEFSDLGAGGIKIGETQIREKESDQAFGNEVSDCHIHDGGKMFHSAVGLWIGQSSNNRVTHNEIANFYYTGISIGWTWGYAAAAAGGNLVEWNHVHHIGKLANGNGPILSDMGGIYTLGTQSGTIIRNNLWHDIAGIRYGGWGIYFDEGSTGIVAENNLVYRTTHGSFHQHYGKENVVRNNIFAFARDQQIQRSRAEPHLSFTFERNIVYWDKGALLGSVWSDDKYVFDNNLYWRTDGQPIQFADWSWEKWQRRGQDVHSLVADPLFVAPDKDNFTLKKDSPAEKIRFKPFGLRDVGPRDKTPR